MGRRKDESIIIREPCREFFAIQRLFWAAMVLCREEKSLQRFGEVSEDLMWN